MADLHEDSSPYVSLVNTSESFHPLSEAADSPSEELEVVHTEYCDVPKAPIANYGKAGLIPSPDDDFASGELIFDPLQYLAFITWLEAVPLFYNC